MDYSNFEFFFLSSFLLLCGNVLGSYFGLYLVVGMKPKTILIISIIEFILEEIFIFRISFF